MSNADATRKRALARGQSVDSVGFARTMHDDIVCPEQNNEMSKDKTFCVSNILGKAPGDPKLEDVYTLGRQLGKGAFGIVRLATKRVGGEELAVKSISKSKLMCKEDVKDVQGEVAIMNLVAGHPNVVTLKVGQWAMRRGHATRPRLPMARMMRVLI